ncbi:MAG: N-acetylmuramoyl-L-alanine amidase [Bacteroidota bacterium]|nr:N-acetylmuramoyl-L-alanine amidase [Bacteroidota bacterium]
MTKNNPGLTLCLTFLVLLLSFAANGQPPKSSFKFKTIVIDAGHGGKDPGAHGSYSQEKNVALAIAIKLQRLINQDIDDVNVIMTRNTDKFIPLNRRSEIANENNANLFISIHCNSSPEGTAETAHKEKGILLLVYGFHRQQEQMEALRENASIYIEKDYKKTYAGYGENNPAAFIILNTVMQKYRAQSILFGKLLNTEFVDTDGRRSRGVKEQGVLVLAHSAMPAVLIETGYINNREEEQYLNSESGQSAIARSIVRAIKTYRDEISVK